VFTSETFAFLRELRANNRREWFDENRARYERHAKEPLLAFVRAVRPRLGEISPHFAAEEGSVFRIHRDVRFSRDKSPYKTQLAAQFRHGQVGGPMSEAVHAPAFYFNLAPDGFGEMQGVFGGFGMWQPPNSAVEAIRTRIAEDTDEWRAAVQGLVLSGASLKKVPAGFAPDHACADDLKRKDFISVVPFSEAQAMAPDFVDQFATAMRRAAPLQRFLCEAIGLPF
jgi:uncharacterized protein (TIGR02453 family)